MSDVITTIPNPEEQASYPHDDEVSFGPSLQPAGDSSAENLLPGNALATTKHASLLSRFKYVPSVYIKLAPVLTWST